MQSIQQRWGGHYRSAKAGNHSHLSLAIRKYGRENFRIEVLHQAQTLDELNAMETHFILLYQSYKPENGYNMTLGGEDNIMRYRTGKKNHMYGRAGFGGKKHSKETKKLQSVAQMGRPKSIAHRTSLSRAAKKRFQTPEGRLFREKLRTLTSVRFKGKPKPRAYSLRMAAYNRTRISPLIGRIWATSPEGVSKLIYPNKISKNWTRGRVNHG